MYMFCINNKQQLYFNKKTFINLFLIYTYTTFIALITIQINELTSIPISSIV